MSKPQFVYVSYIETTPEKLWEALTSSEFTRQYWFGAEVRSDWKVGSPFALLLDGEITDSGEILEADPPRRLSYSFKHQKYEELRGEPAALEFSDPAFADLMDRHRVEIVQLLAAMLDGRDQIGLFEDDEVLGDGLPRHRKALAKFVQCLAVPGVKPVQQRPSRPIGERSEDFIHGCA